MPHNPTGTRISEFSNSWAYIIGVDDYQQQHGIPPLRTAVNDAEQIAALLEQAHGYQVRRLPCGGVQATLDEFRRLLNTTMRDEIGEHDRLLFYFAGHGKALDGEDGPVGVLVPQDARLEDRNSFLPMTELHDALAILPCRHMLLILDCCFSGSFRWSATRDLGQLPDIVYQERFARYTQDAAWQVIASSAADQLAWDFDSEKRKHSLFAAALLRGLQGEADLIPRAKNGKPAGDGVITTSELHLYLRHEVEQQSIAAGMRQTPGLWPLKKHDKGEFIFLVPGGVPDLPPAPELTEELNPWRGLKSYEEDDVELFFGRQKQIRQLHRTVLRQPLTIVTGASGTGKSSLVKAGYLPRLRGHRQPWRMIEQLRPDSEKGDKSAASVRPGASPLKTLASLLMPGDPAAQKEHNETLEHRVRGWLDANEKGNLLLVIDQFEELITLCSDQDARNDFIQQLARAVDTAPDRFRLIVTVRSDFEPQFADSAFFGDRWSDKSRFIVPPLSQDELREIIEHPASVRVLYFKPRELVDKLINEVVQTPGALPLLSFTLSELYMKYLQRNCDDRSLTLEDYNKLGGVAGSLRNRATEIYNELGKRDEASGHAH